MWRECVIFVMVCVFGAGSLSGRGFFCRDPDTGKLHPANSTWTATTFCGKYHCKLKRKNITSSQYAPLRKINITNLQLLGQNLTEMNVQTTGVLDKRKDTVNSSLDNKTKSDILDGNNFTKEFQEITLNDGKNVSDKDRYLTDQEIKSITELLHTLKKGDLDAIVEIYNLAQDIYKELDKTSTDHVLQEAMTTAKTLKKQIIESDMYKKVTKHNHASYWYEPLFSGKVRLTDLVRPDVIRTDVNPAVPAVVVGLDPPVPVNVVPKPTPSIFLPPVTLIPPTPGFQLRKISDTFFNSPLTNTDFGKLPYYYPMSNFQRLSSYHHNTNKIIASNAGTLPPTPVRPSPTLASTPVPNSVHKAVTNKSIQIGGKYQKDLGPSIFLPYPFASIQHYNWSFPPNIYHRRKIETHRKENSVFDKLELLTREEDLYVTPKKGESLIDSLGKRRKEGTFVDQLEKRRKEDFFLNQIGIRKKQENVLDKLDLLTKEENLFNQFEMRRTEENVLNQIGIRKKQDNILDKLELLTKEENLFDNLGSRKMEKKLSDQLEIRRKNDASNKNTITINKRGDKKSNAILMNPDLENFQDLQIRSSMKEENIVNTNPNQEEENRGLRKKERRRPDWQTDSLPQQILDEVRAHIQEKQRLFIHPVPLRKKVKLERVANLLNMDQITRRKRSVNEQSPIDEPLEPDLFEVYIESTTCNADYTIPGYFRYGNLTQPFPECCPQRIPAR